MPSEAAQGHESGRFFSELVPDPVYNAPAETGRRQTRPRGGIRNIFRAGRIGPFRIEFSKE